MPARFLIRFMNIKTLMFAAVKYIAIESLKNDLKFSRRLKISKPIMSVNYEVRERLFCDNNVQYVTFA